MNNDQNRESVPEAANRLGLAGIEFVEYATSRPQALGQVLEMMGFRPVARHRSREVVLYRQGGMNLVVNAHPEDARVAAGAGDAPVLSAVAFRVADAGRAFQRCLDLGAWEVPSQAKAMELHIPCIHGPGSSRFYFVDRWHEFSIYDIDFVPIPTVDMNPPALAGMQYFGIVQYVGTERTAEWITYYENLFDFSVIPDEERFGILPNGALMRSPCGGFLWQLVDPIPWGQGSEAPESLQRIGIGVPDVAQAVSVLRSRGVEFVDSSRLHPDVRGALTAAVLAGVTFELVRKPA